MRPPAPQIESEGPVRGDVTGGAQGQHAVGDGARDGGGEGAGERGGRDGRHGVPRPARIGPRMEPPPMP